VADEPGILTRLRWRPNKLPLPSILFENVQSLENKLYQLHLSLSIQRDLENCTIL
jgi:hypothetical protein